MKSGLAVSCAVFAVAVATHGAAHAQTIYRCGTTYSSVPCPNGRALESTQPTTAAQRAEARQVAARERRLAADMERDRRVEEASRAPATASSLSPAASKPAPVVKTKSRAAKKKLAPGTTPSGDFLARPPVPPPEPKRPPPT